MNVVAWVEASAARGLGHAGRGAAVVEAALERGWGGRLVVSGDTALVRGALGAGVAVESFTTTTLVELTPADLVVVDGYGFDDAVLTELRARVGAVALIDDTELGTRPVDLIVNADLDVPFRADCPVLTGWHHALIRADFRLAARPPETRTDGPLLLTFGGSDPTGLGPRLVDELTRLEWDARPTVLLQGPGAAPWRGPAPDWLELVSAPRRAVELMAAAAAAITAAGVTATELAVLGVPMAVVPAVEDQRRAVARLSAADAAVAIDPADLGSGARRAVETLFDPRRRIALTSAASRLVDGLGADRVLDALAAARRPAQAPRPLADGDGRPEEV